MDLTGNVDKDAFMLAWESMIGHAAKSSGSPLLITTAWRSVSGPDGLVRLDAAGELECPIEVREGQTFVVGRDSRSRWIAVVDPAD
jgi:hypothetical protein